jgi:hypothetical protein
MRLQRVLTPTIAAAIVLGMMVIGPAGAGANGMQVKSAAAPMANQPAALPFTYYLTHYQLHGAATSPTGVTYHSGHPFADGANGSRITLTGHGAWDPAAGTATGGGKYVITDSAGAVTAQGTWKATSFISFLQLAGWWGIPGFTEDGWQGPAGSPSFSGFLKIRVRLENLGDAVLTTWCLMPSVKKPGDHVGDGLSITGANVDFTDYHAAEHTLEGHMFYGPGQTP